MTGQSTDMGNSSLLVGQVLGKQESMAGEIRDIKVDMVRMWEAQSDMGKTLVRIEQNTSAVPDILDRLDAIELRCQRRHPNDITTRQIHRKPEPSPLEKPIGRTLAEWGLEALKKVIILAAAGLIVLGVVKVSGAISPEQPPAKEVEK